MSGLAMNTERRSVNSFQQDVKLAGLSVRKRSASSGIWLHSRHLAKALIIKIFSSLHISMYHNAIAVPNLVLVKLS